MGETVFKRKLYSSMLQWKEEKKGATALLIKGARRVGKSTLAEQFAKNEYESYLLLTSTAKILYFSYQLIINHIRYDVRIFG